MSKLIQTYLPNVYKIGLWGEDGWLMATYTTLYMTVWAFLIGGLIGLLTGLFLVLTAPEWSDKRALKLSLSCAPICANVS